MTGDLASAESKMLSNLVHIFMKKIKLPTGALGTINLKVLVISTKILKYSCNDDKYTAIRHPNLVKKLLAN